LAGAFSAAMLTARLAAGALISAASIAEEDLPVDLVIVASVVVATRLGMLHRIKPPWTVAQRGANTGKTGESAKATRLRCSQRQLFRARLAPFRCNTCWALGVHDLIPRRIPGVGGAVCL